MQQKKHKKTKMYNYCKIGKNKEKNREVTNMNINGKMLAFVAVVAVVATGAMVYFAGGEQEKPKGQQVYVREENIRERKVEESKESYQVSLVDGDVILYCIKNGEKTEVERIGIDVGYYPDEDIKELTRGIEAYNVEEGYRILENFAN